MDTIDELLTRGVENIIPGKEKLAKILRSGKKLNIYFGIDPTSTNIHLGHAVPIRKLQTLANLGHHVTFLIGDFTALIGDTSDKESERPQLTSDQIKSNFETYKKQAEKLLDFSKINVKFNSEWLQKLSFADIVKLTQHFSAGDFVGRELIKKRLNAGKHVGLHELLYPVMQGYDSYFLDTDLQLGGTDQTFNMQAGRILQKDLRNKESFVIASGFLTGTDGRKMSKTWNNAIWLTDKPDDMYGKIMSVKDELIVEYFMLATSTPISAIEEIRKQLTSGKNPMQVKKELARMIVTDLHGSKQATAAGEHFEQAVQHGQAPDTTPTWTPPQPSLTALATVSAVLSISNSEARRMIEQGGFYHNNTRIDHPSATIMFQTGDIIKVGKHTYRKIKL